MSHVRVLAACTLVWSSFSLAFVQQAKSPPPTDSLFQETVSQLDSAHLSSGQIAQIAELAARYEPKIRRAELQAAETSAQRRARDEAIASAINKGLRGAPARDLLTRATSRTEEQRAAFQQAARLRREFDKTVIGMLTDSQKLGLEKPVKRGAASSGFLIVQLSPDLRLPPREAKTLDEAAAALELPGLRAVIAKFDLRQSERAVKPELLDRLGDTDNPSTGGEIRLLRTFWQIDIRTMKHEEIEPALKSLNALPAVARAYLAHTYRDPSPCCCVHPTTNPYYHCQGYLWPAPAGIDAQAAWSVSGGRGAGVGLVDLERGWNICHEDLKAIMHDPVYGDMVPGVDHGTSVVGEIAAQDNRVGIVGAAPCAAYVAVTSPYHTASGIEPHLANAIAAAAFVMDPGDVLLIERETDDCFPVEIDPVNYHAIRLAVAKGMVLVEPTGNGDHDLDAYLDSAGHPILNRQSPYFLDSRAIIVGSSDPTMGHNKAGASCYGSRLDCFGWGNYVATTGVPNGDILDDGGGDPNKSYRSKFNGTSSAAPIVAGAAMLVQGLWKDKHGIALSSTAMRQILSDPSTGTPQGTVVPGRIGVMPNLKAIIAANALGDCWCSETGPVDNRCQ